jgi:hypothetical protein
MREHHAARRVPPLGSSCLAALAVLSLGQASAWMTPSFVSRQARPPPLPAATAACRSASRCTVAALRMGVEGSEAPRKGQTGGKSVVLSYFKKRHPLSLGPGLFDPNKVGPQDEKEDWAEARHRQIFGGYHPKSRNQSAPAQLYQASAMPLTCEVADAPRLPAPAAKPEPWDTASAPTKESASMETHPAAESARGAPAKTWQPYGGYVPRSRKTEKAVQETLSASTPQDVHASTHVHSTTTSTVMAHELGESHRWLIGEIAAKVAEIQQPGLNDYKILELDSLIIGLVGERVRVERGIIELGGHPSSFLYSQAKDRIEEVEESEIGKPAAVSNSIVHVYKPMGTEDEEPLQQRLATAGVPLAHARSCCESAATGCTLAGSAIAL